MSRLENKKVAFLATHGFEHSELFEPKKALEEQGAQIDIVSLEKGKIKSWKDNNWGEEIAVDRTVSEASPADYHALVLPGGVINPDLLRKNEHAVNFVKGFFEKGKQKPVSAICHGPWMLVEADVVKGRVMTSYDSIKTDLKNAGADWADREVVVDKGLVTSRNPNDLAAFISKTIEEIVEGTHDR